jgi:hypothetical protein
MMLFGMAFLAKGRNKIKMIERNKALPPYFSGAPQAGVVPPLARYHGPRQVVMEDHQDDVMALQHDCDCIRDRFNLKAGGAHKSKAVWSGLTTFG